MADIPLDTHPPPEEAFDIWSKIDILPCVIGEYQRHRIDNENENGRSMQVISSRAPAIRSLRHFVASSPPPLVLSPPSDSILLDHVRLGDLLVSPAAKSLQNHHLRPRRVEGDYR